MNFVITFIIVHFTLIHRKTQSNTNIYLESHKNERLNPKWQLDTILNCYQAEPRTHNFTNLESF